MKHKPKYEVTCINIDHEAFAQADRRDRRKAALARTSRPERAHHLYQCRLLSRQVRYLCGTTPQTRDT